MINATPAFGLYGLGGVGKTQVALKYLHSNFSRFSHIFWVYEDTDSKLMNEFDTISKKLGMKNSSSSRNQAIEYFHAWLQEHSEWLWSSTTWRMWTLLALTGQRRSVAGDALLLLREIPVSDDRTALLQRLDK